MEKEENEILHPFFSVINIALFNSSKLFSFK